MVTMDAVSVSFVLVSLWREIVGPMSLFPAQASTCGTRIYRHGPVTARFLRTDAMSPAMSGGEGGGQGGGKGQRGDMLKHLPNILWYSAFWLAMTVRAEGIGMRKPCLAL